MKVLVSFWHYKLLILNAPTEGIDFFPGRERGEKRTTLRRLRQLIASADPGTGDYLTVQKEIEARTQEVNLLVWQDVNFTGRTPNYQSCTKRLNDIELLDM